VVAASAVALLGLERVLPGTEVSSESSDADELRTDPATGWLQVGSTFPDEALADLPALPVLGSADVGQAALPDAVADSPATLVNVWASTCAPCRDELPALQALADRDLGIGVVGVSRDTRERFATELLETQHVRFANYLDEGGWIVDAFQGDVSVAYLPATLLVEDGVITWVHVGPFNSADEIEDEVRERLTTV